ncbi:hypothetical protein [Streptomyces malaysiensis]|uniref:Uncharacterized protein n=1 Tax=Streptomyces malaysiensis subsp. samsunensis TaxID=459658 RepID=A0A9X2LTE4_STRMQ|nr:hypothetical protein [Streptomyces samsunensis]MCQ8829428.1 hypothetical protein [Streptomyces samsunensis]
MTTTESRTDDGAESRTVRTGARPGARPCGRTGVRPAGYGLIRVKGGERDVSAGRDVTLGAT